MCGQTHITPMFEIVGDFGIQQPEKQKNRTLGDFFSNKGNISEVK